MVRVSQSSRKRLINQHYRNNNKLINNHLFNLLIVAVIFLAISLYFYLLNREEKAYAETKAELLQEEVAKGKLASLERNVKESESLEHLRHKEESMAAAPSTMILPASRVLSSGLPFLIYGTAWKKEETAHYVAEAVRNGFRFIDTACQPKHYREDLVGEGWTNAAKELGLSRSDIFLQTKFTSISGQDPKNIPYDKTKPLEEMVAESLQVSLRNLQTTYLDSWVMHSPLSTVEETMVAYRVMEQAVDDGKVKRLGISNCYNLEWLSSIYERARIKPSVLQNRFYGESQWDQDIRQFCKTHDMWYQSFWTLTANIQALHSEEAKTWAASKQLTPQTLMYAYIMQLGYGRPLDGTRSVAHMKEDIAVMQRIQDGEKIFDGEADMRRFERLLGFHDQYAQY